MKSTVSRTNLNLLTDHLFSRYGLIYTAKKEDDLKNALLQTAETLNVDTEGAIEKLQTESGKGEISALILDNLKINETYFFREEQTLYRVCSEVLNKSYLDQTKIWSAGCSSGEEPYSLIIILAEQDYIFSNTSFKLDATDVNPNSIDRAKTGIYSSWSFRNTPSEIRYKYFDKVGDNYEIKNHLKKWINFRMQNLNEDIPSSSTHLEDYYDIILCRNVLIYFNDEMRQKIFNNFFRSLKPGGLLFTGLTEIAFLKDPRFEKSIDKQMIYFRKPDRKTAVETSILENTATTETFSPVKKEHSETVSPNDNLLSKAKHFYNSGEYEKCIGDIKKIFEDKTDVNIYSEKNGESIKLLMKAYINTGKNNEAINECHKYLRYNKNEYNFYLMLANLYVHSDNNDSAIDNLVKAIYLNPDYIPAHLLLGKIYLTKGDKLSAKKHYEITLKLAEGMNTDYIIEDTDGFSAGSVVQLMNNILKKI